MPITLIALALLAGCAAPHPPAPDRVKLALAAQDPPLDPVELCGGPPTALAVVARPPPRCPKSPRSKAALDAFRRKHPCPAGEDKGSIHGCRGFVIDHKCPLSECCGVDAPKNMQYQTYGDGKAKDQWEWQCERSCGGTR